MSSELRAFAGGVTAPYGAGRFAERSTKLDELQREAILRALHSCDWVIGGPQGAAALLGLERTALHARMQKLASRVRTPTRGALSPRPG